MSDTDKLLLLCDTLSYTLYGAFDTWQGMDFGAFIADVLASIKNGPVLIPARR